MIWYSDMAFLRPSHLILYKSKIIVGLDYMGIISHESSPTYIIQLLNLCGSLKYVYKSSVHKFTLKMLSPTLSLHMKGCKSPSQSRKDKDEHRVFIEYQQLINSNKINKNYNYKINTITTTKIIQLRKIKTLLWGLKCR